MSLYLDHHEALDLYLSLSQSLDCQMVALNESGRPDIFWVDCEGRSRGIEHKQVSEILGGLDDVEELLARQYPGTDQLYLMVEGVLFPQGGNQAVTLGWSRDNKTAYRKGRGSGKPAYDFNWDGWEKWQEGLEDYGIRVKHVPNREALVRAIVALYNRSQVGPELHHTFRRVIRSKLNIPVALPMVRSLMGLCGNDSRTNTGEAIATALERRYGSLWALQQADPAEVAEVRLESGRRVGVAWAKWFFEEAIGKVE